MKNKLSDRTLVQGKRKSTGKKKKYSYSACNPGAVVISSLTENNTGILWFSCSSSPVARI